jgi:membrane protein implicated in regulation of membrane protease activity
VGLAALAVTTVTDWGYPVTFVVAGGVSIASAELIARLQRPGLPSTLPRAHSEAQLIG